MCLHGQPAAFGSMRRATFAAVVALAALSLEPQAAHADNGLRVIGQVAEVLYVGGLSLVPNRIGGDFSLDPIATPRALVGWSFQFPLEPNERHRVVVGGGFALGIQKSGTREAVATFDMRAGYRFVALRSSPSPYFGLGSTLENWPVLRPSISPEVGLRFGESSLAELRDYDPGFVFTLGIQGDVYFASDHDVRLALLVGWAFF